MRSTRRRRMLAAASAVAIVAAGLAVHLLLPDSAASDIAGDVLYTALIYALVVVIAPRLRPLAVGAICAGWCVAIELFQLTGIPNSLGGAFPPATLVLGTVFDPRDLVVGIVSSALAAALDTWLPRRRAGRSPHTDPHTRRG